MKRDRNTFFTNYNAQQASYVPNMPNMQMPAMDNSQFGPYQAANTQSSFYAGPNLNTTNNDLENRIAKIERQLNRFDARLSKLESLSSGNGAETNNYTNMYMI